jgi:uncharacterized repeat protein (TIGR01451 family)
MKLKLAATVALSLSGAATAQQAPRPPVAAPAPVANAPTAVQPAVQLSSKAFVVKQVPGAGGKLENKLETPTTVLPGAVLLFVLEYRNTGKIPATKFVINNPIPASVSFTGSEQSWAVVSVDGNKSFGPLATLKVPDGAGKVRPAKPADVTGIRWTFGQPIPPGSSGKVMYYGIVK